ncbi:hypothetical protein [Kitasatospora cineracea]|uniref:hypothetical protein n=1 Tax=Kitasatospora cineracea TaxID=88074 RepID=UPI0036A50B21
MTRRQQRDRIETALTNLGLNTGGQNARRTYAGLLADTFAPELARGADAEETVVRVRAAVHRLPADAAVPVRTILNALYGEERP